MKNFELPEAPGVEMVDCIVDSNNNLVYGPMIGANAIVDDVITKILNRNLQTITVAGVLVKLKNIVLKDHPLVNRENTFATICRKTVLQEVKNERDFLLCRPFDDNYIKKLISYSYCLPSDDKLNVLLPKLRENGMIADLNSLCASNSYGLHVSSNDVLFNEVMIDSGYSG